MSLLAPVRRVGVGGALLGWGTGKVLLDLMTGLESLLAAAGRTEGVTQKDRERRLFLKNNSVRKRQTATCCTCLMAANGHSALHPREQSTDTPKY